MARMTKIVPASRRVTEASLVPPANVAFSRASGPAGRLVVSSMAAKAEILTRVCGDGSVYQPFVKIGLGVPLYPLPLCEKVKPGSWRSLQINIEFVGAIGADQGQFQRGALGIDAGRDAVELERKSLHPGRTVFPDFWNRQAPIRCRSFDEQVDGPCVRRDHVDQHLRLSLAFDVADGQRIGIADIGRLWNRIERREQGAVLGARH